LKFENFNSYLTKLPVNLNLSRLKLRSYVIHSRLGIKPITGNRIWILANDQKKKIVKLKII